MAEERGAHREKDTPHRCGTNVLVIEAGDQEMTWVGGSYGPIFIAKWPTFVVGNVSQCLNEWRTRRT